MLTHMAFTTRTNVRLCGNADAHCFYHEKFASVRKFADLFPRNADAHGFYHTNGPIFLNPLFRPPESTTSTTLETMEGNKALPSSPKDQLRTCSPSAVSALANFHANGDIEKSKHSVVDLRVETSQDEVVVDRLPETPGQEPNVASGTRAEQCDRRAPECPEFPSVSSFDLHPSDESIPDFTDDVAEELRIASLQSFQSEIHSARANHNRTSDDSDGGSVLLDPVPKVHLTRSMSLSHQPSQCAWLKCDHSTT